MLVDLTLPKLVAFNGGPLAGQDVLALLLPSMPEAHEGNQQGLAAAVQGNLLLGDPASVISLIDVAGQCIDVCARHAKDVANVLMHHVA